MSVITGTNEDDLVQFFDTDYYTDMTVRCGDQQWKGHSLVICGRSKWFNNACSGSFKEAKTRVVQLQDDEPAIVEQMLRFLYGGSYEIPVDQEWSVAAIDVHAKMHMIADKYQVPALMELAAEQFASIVSARGYDLVDLLREVPRIYTYIPSITSPTSRKMRQSVRDTIAQEYSMSINDATPQHNAQQKAYKSLCAAAEESHPFAFDLVTSFVSILGHGNSELFKLLAAARRGDTVKRFVCVNCEQRRRTNPMDIRTEEEAAEKCTKCVAEAFDQEWSALCSEADGDEEMDVAS